MQTSCSYAEPVMTVIQHDKHYRLSVHFKCILLTEGQGKINEFGVQQLLPKK